MKQIARLKLVAVTFLLAFSVASAFTIASPQSALAAGCQANPATDSQATNQQNCVSKHIEQCEKDFPRLKNLCGSLSVTQINKCAENNYKLKKNCLENINKSIEQCLKFDGKTATTATTNEYKRLNCDNSEGGPCQGSYSAGRGGYSCTDQRANPSDADDTLSTDYDENDCSESYSSLNGDNCKVLGVILLITNVLSGIAATVIVAMMIYGGIQYSSAGADPSKVQAAKQKIYNALLALFLFIFGFALIQWLVPGGLF